MHRDRLGAAAGIIWIVLLIVSFALIGEAPETEDSSAEEIAAHFTENKDSIIAGVLVQSLALVALLYFAGYLRRVLRAAEGEGGVLATVALAGAIVLAVGAAIDSTLSAALAESAENVDPVAIQALQALWENDFVPFLVGMVTFLSATGLSIIRHRALPSWLGWVPLVLVVSFLIAGITEIEAFWAIFGFGTALWVLVLSGILVARAGRPGKPAERTTAI